MSISAYIAQGETPYLYVIGYLFYDKMLHAVCIHVKKVNMNAD